jgi:hypothetical protein
MIRPTTLVTFGIAACLGAGLFKVKYAVQGEEQKLVTIQQQIARDQSAVHVLNAEWSAETTPQQLGEMAERHLQLSPITSAALGTFAVLPMRPAAPGQPAPAVTAPAAAPIPAPAIAAVQPQDTGAAEPARTVVANAGDASVDAVLQAMQASLRQSGAATGDRSRTVP